MNTLFDERTQERERITRPTRSEAAPILRRPDINYDLMDHDVTEVMWLWRHRQPSFYGVTRGRKTGSMSQVEAAEHLKLTAAQYMALEHGDTTLLSAEDIVNLRRKACWDPVKPTTAELCFLARRRSKLTIKAIAKQMGISTYTYIQAEDAGQERVRAYWTRKGYEFP